MDITLTLFDAGAVLTLPAIIAVRRLLTLRLAAPLPRSVLESNLVLASSLAGAIGAIAWACVVPEAEMTLAFGAAPLGVIPWIAGETLSGGSSRRWESLGAAIVTAAATIWACFALISPAWQQAKSAELLAIVAAAEIATALAAAYVYLAVRGAPESLPIPAR